MAESGYVIFMRAFLGLPSFKTFCAYILIILLSPVWQHVTKPISLRPVLVFYNFACSALSVYTFIGFTYFGVIRAPHIYYMQPVRKLDTIFYLYWIAKNLELLDTVFMILRHKQRQITFLHVFHHGSMVVLSNYAYLYTAWPAIAIYLAMNSFVHIVLYLYYGMAALNPENPPQWKKTLTQLQIIQFLVGLCFSYYGYVYKGFCIYSILYGLSMTALFSNFYYRAYMNGDARRKSKVN